MHAGVAVGLGVVFFGFFVSSAGFNQCLFCFVDGDGVEVAEELFDALGVPAHVVNVACTDDGGAFAGQAGDFFGELAFGLRPAECFFG